MFMRRLLLMMIEDDCKFFFLGLAFCLWQALSIVSSDLSGRTKHACPAI
jgi:hypothetical protein